jgi:hypothetical protein
MEFRARIGRGLSKIEFSDSITQIRPELITYSDRIEGKSSAKNLAIFPYQSILIPIQTE